MFKNTQGIEEIIMEQESWNNCPLGKAHYKNNFTISMRPGEIIPDYLEVEEFVKTEINDKNLIIEDCVEKLFNFVDSNYHPTDLRVESYATEAKHHNVRVIKIKEASF